jgi:hypothetical protein
MILLLSTAYASGGWQGVGRRHGGTVVFTSPTFPHWDLLNKWLGEKQRETGHIFMSSWTDAKGKDWPQKGRAK